MTRAASLALTLLVAAQLAADEPKKDPPKDPKPDNSQISKFVDETPSFKGKVVCFQLTYKGGKNAPLRERLGDKSVPFVGKDPDNGAKLVLGLDIPKDLTVPDIKEDEEAVVTFLCVEGKTGMNRAISITRPTKKK